MILTIGEAFGLLFSTILSAWVLYQYGLENNPYIRVIVLILHVPIFVFVIEAALTL